MGFGLRRHASTATIEWTSAPDSEARELRARVHGMLERIDRDYARFQFNTVIAGCMELVNALERYALDPHEVAEGDAGLRGAAFHEAVVVVLKVLAPIVPHIAHALWEELGQREPLIDAPWPQVDGDALRRETVSLVVQVNGKLRGQIEVACDADRDVIRAAALADDGVRRHVGDSPIRKVILVPGRLINIVV